jgi:hypothetical protein
MLVVRGSIFRRRRRKMALIPLKIKARAGIGALTFAAAVAPGGRVVQQTPLQSRSMEVAMKISTLSVALILSLAFAAPAASVEIVYIERAIGTGTINGKSFTNDLVTLEAVGDTDAAPSSGTFQTYTLPVGMDVVDSMGAVIGADRSELCSQSLLTRTIRRASAKCGALLKNSPNVH